jgi:hypothetical protein
MPSAFNLFAPDDASSPLLSKPRALVLTQFFAFSKSRDIKIGYLSAIF